MYPYIVAGLIFGVTCFVLMKVVRGGGSGKPALDAKAWQSFRLSEKIAVSEDTFIFRFALHNPDQTLGLPTGSHIAIRAICNVKEEVEAEDGGKSVAIRKHLVQHSYTPISSDEDKGRVDFLVKVYFENVHPKFPFGGRLTQYINGLKIGQTLDMMGPKGRFEYLGKGRYTIANKPATTGAFAMIAGGTGITPMLQVMRAIRRDPADKTKVFLVYGNQTEKDILLRAELDELVAAAPAQFNVWYTIDREPTPTWKYDVGFVTEDMLRRNLPAVNDKNTVNKKDVGVSSVLALMCGPPPMLQFAIKPNLDKMGYSTDMMFSF